MSKFISSEVFRLGTLRKYERKKDVAMFADRHSLGPCDDWCEITIATREPYISNICFAHRGCLLSKACVNAIITAIENKTRDEAFEIIYSFMDMLTTSRVNPDLPENLKLFQKFSKFASRRKCMLLGCKLAIKELGEK